MAALSTGFCELESNMKKKPSIQQVKKSFRTGAIKALPAMLKESFIGLSKNDPLRMAGATAFFTSFALPPILIILIQVLGLVFNKSKISKKLFDGLAGIIEKESMAQVVSTLKAFRSMADNWFITIGGFLFLLFVATTLFKVIKDSINQLWGIRIAQSKSLRITMKGRFQSFMLIVMAGVLFIPGIFLTAAQAFLEDYMPDISDGLSFYFNSGLNYLVSVIIVTLWFSILFRYLPDGRPSWKVALTGAFLTSILFNTGKFILHWLLTHGNIQELYGPSGSVVVLLLFVFYSSLILYFGASFTRVWAIWLKTPITPLPYAVQYEISEIHGKDL